MVSSMVGKREGLTTKTMRMGWDGMRVGKRTLGKRACGGTSV